MVLLNLFTAVSTTSRILSTSGFIVVAGKLQICKKKTWDKKNLLTWCLHAIGDKNEWTEWELFMILCSYLTSNCAEVSTQALDACKGLWPWPLGAFTLNDITAECAPLESCVSFALCSQLGWAKRAGWLEDAMAGPGRPVTGPGRTRGRLPANWAQRIALQQAQTQADPIKIPKKRGPKPGSKVEHKH